MNGLPQPYRVAILGAMLAAVFSGILNECTGRHSQPAQVDHGYSPSQLFLERLNSSDAPQLTRLLSLARRTSFLDTDGEIQSFEYQAEALFEKEGLEVIQLQFDIAATPLRVYGSSEVRIILDDIGKALLFRDEDIDWQRYGTMIATHHESIREAQESGSAYGFEERISPEVRLMIFSFALLNQRLFDQLQLETACNTFSPGRNT